MRIREILALALTMLSILSWLLFSIAVILRGPVRRCPKCGAKRIRHSWPRRADLLLPAFIVPRRCESCCTRFYNLESVNYLRRPMLADAPRSVRRPKIARSA